MVMYIVSIGVESMNYSGVSIKAIYKLDINIYTFNC